MRDNDDEDIGLAEILKFGKIFNLGKDVLLKMVSTERGIGLFAVLIGLLIKQTPRKYQLVPEWSKIPEVVEGLRNRQGNVQAYCTEANKIAQEKGTPSVCELVPETSIDLVPIQLPGLPHFDNFGKVPVSDFLIFCGAIGISGFNIDTVKSIVGAFS